MIIIFILIITNLISQIQYNIFVLYSDIRILYYIYNIN